MFNCGAISIVCKTILYMCCGVRLWNKYFAVRDKLSIFTAKFNLSSKRKEYEIRNYLYREG